MLRYSLLEPLMFLYILLYTSQDFAAAAAKSLQSCPTLCDPIDGSPPGSPVPGTLQARTLEWVAISFSNAWKWKVKVKSLSRVWLLATLWTQPTKFLHPLDFPGKSTGVVCHCFLHPSLWLFFFFFFFKTWAGSWSVYALGNPEKVMHCSSQHLVTFQRNQLAYFLFYSSGFPMHRILWDSPYCVCRPHWTLHIAWEVWGLVQRYWYACFSCCNW